MPRRGRPKRSIVFLAVTAEESGLLGSKYYAENPIYPLGQTVGGVNMDALNVIGPAKDFVIDRRAASPSSRIYVERAGQGRRAA